MEGRIIIYEVVTASTAQVKRLFHLVPLPHGSSGSRISVATLPQPDFLPSSTLPSMCFVWCYGTHFTSPGNTCSAAAEIKLAMERGELFRAQSFEYACAQSDIDHRLTKPKHPWTNGQVERMNRTLKEATVKRFYYQTHDQLRLHLDQFVAAYNFARRLKTLKCLTPYEFICKSWTKQPQRFRLNPIH